MLAGKLAGIRLTLVFSVSVLFRSVSQTFRRSLSLCMLHKQQNKTQLRGQVHWIGQRSKLVILMTKDEHHQLRTCTDNVTSSGDETFGIMMPN